VAATAPAPVFRWQRLRAALTSALRASAVELVDLDAGRGRGRGELATYVAIAMHQHLTGHRDPGEPVELEGEGEGMKRSTKRLLIGAAAGLAVYHFVIAKK